MLPKLLLSSLALFLLASPLLAQQDVVLYLFGRVVMEDGTQPSRDFRVEMICDGKVVRQSHPNEKGIFSFDLGSRKQSQGVSDASASPTTGGLTETFAQNAWNPEGFKVLLGRVYLDDCLIRLGPNPEFRATDIKLGIRGLMDDPDVGEILVSRGSVALGTVDAAIPTEARKEFTGALDDLSKEKPDRKNGRKHLEEAVRICPEYADAWELLGRLDLEERKTVDARSAFEKAAAIDSTRIRPCLELAEIGIDSKDWEAAHQWSARALELQPDVAKGLLYLGLAYYYQNEFAQSHAAIGRLEELGEAEKYPIAVLHLGMLFARMGDIPAAASRLEKYLELEPSAARRGSVERQLEAWRKSGELKQSTP